VNSRFKMIESVAAQSEAQCKTILNKELSTVWTDWRDREVEAEKQLKHVNEEIEELRRRIATLELEEKHVMDEVGRQRAVRLVPKQQLHMLNMELQKASSVAKQHENEFDARSREQSTKITAAQDTVESLTRELAQTRQRNFEDEASIREQHLRRLEIKHLRISELTNYKNEVMPIVAEYNALKAKDLSAAQAKISRLRALGDKHRAELSDILRPFE